MKTKLHDWRIDEVLKTPEDRAIYIQAAMDEHDPAYLAKALGNVSRIEGEERIAKRAKMTMEDFKADFTIGGNPTLRAFMRVIDALGLQLAMQPKARVSV